MILSLRGQHRGLASIKGEPQFLETPKTRDPSPPLTRQPQAQQDAVVDDRNDTSHTRGPCWDLRPMAFQRLAWPTAIGCGQQGCSWLAGWEGWKGSGLEHLVSSRPDPQQPNPDPDPDPEVFFHPCFVQIPDQGQMTIPIAKSTPQPLSGLASP